MIRRLLPPYALIALLIGIALFESGVPYVPPAGVAAPIALPPPPPPAPPKPLPLPPLADVTVAPPPERAAPADPTDPTDLPAESEASAPPDVPTYFSGLAIVTGKVNIMVGRIPVSLFGIRAPAPRSVCGLGMDCDTALRTTLSALLSEGSVSCHLPQPARGIPAFAICLDHQGRDIAGYLIDGGLAQADTSQSYDYYDAQNIAHQLKRGRWQYQ